MQGLRGKRVRGAKELLKRCAEGLDAFIFDFDGTLADSMGVWEWVDSKFLEKHGVNPPDGYGQEFAGKGFRAGAEYVKELFSLRESPQEIMDEWNRLAYERYSSGVGLRPGAAEYVASVKEQGKKVAIATANNLRLVEVVLGSCGCRGLFDCIVTDDDICCDKSLPDIYLLAASRLGVEPGRCVVFEDALPGIRSAKSAGMLAIGTFADTRYQEADEVQMASDAFFFDFSELL